MHQKTHFYRFLMASSLGLLVLFQGYWLRSVYQEQKELLDTDLDNIFGQNIRDLQDSLYRNNWVAMRNSLTKQGTIVQIAQDSISGLSTGKQQSAAIFIRIDSSMVRSGKPLSSHLEWGKNHKTRQETRLERRARFFTGTVTAFKTGDSVHSWPGVVEKKDTLEIPMLTRRIKMDMGRAGLAFPFKLYQSDTIPALDQSGITTFHSGGFPPVHLYVITFYDYHTYLFKRMALNLLFALILLSITSISFLMIFRSLRQQQRLAKLKNDFISNITHELKTPIATVSVALEALHNFQVINNPEKTKEYLNISQHELQRLSILVDRVLKMSMFESKSMQLHRERFDLRTSMEKVVQSMGLQFERARANVEWHVEGNDFIVEGDAVHLTNVMYNLLDNALKYSPKKPQIHIYMVDTGEAISLSVADNGLGIPKEYQHKIFEQFFRAPQQGQQHNTKGYGLGLSYVTEVLRQHAGKIRVESTIGQGSTFIVTLPKNYKKQ